jgi:uncharacterized protein YecE (DUF72 family)
MSRLFIGTSGWNYPHWRSVFYPSYLRQSQWLQYYVKFFNCVELNVTFYRLMQKKTFQNWRKHTPKGFYFIAKGSRFITHIKRLKSVKDPLDLFLNNAQGLGNKLAALLWQLPPSFKKDITRIEMFLKLLKKTNIRQVFEFRNDSWFDAETFRLLKEYNACLCIAHSDRFPCVREVTADFLYLRFHGGKSLYGSDYSRRELKRWAEFSGGVKVKDIFAFFNNDACGYAVKNARQFKGLLENK